MDQCYDEKESIQVQRMTGGNRVMRYLMAMAIMLLAALQVWCQPDIVYFERFDESKGLPHNLFRLIIQDRQGLLWMGGPGGLAKYDGYTFTEYRHNDEDSLSLSGNNILKLFEDSKDRLWVATSGAGINVSDNLKTFFTRINLQKRTGQEALLAIHDITEDRTGKIWIATGEGLIILHEVNGSFKITEDQKARIMPHHKDALSRPVSLYTSENGQVWIGTTQGMCMYDEKLNQWHGPEAFEGLPRNSIQQISTDRLGRMWVSAKNDGPRLFYATDDPFRFQSFDKIPIKSATRDVKFAFDLDNRIWLSVFGEEGFAYDFDKASLFLSTKQNSNIQVERFLRKPMVDHSGNVWIGGEGFYVYRYPKGFNHYHHPFAFHQSNTCIYIKDSTLWLAYREKGLVRLRTVSGQAAHFSVTREGDYHIPSDHIQKLHSLKNGNKIIIGFGNISIMDPDDKVIKNFRSAGTNRSVFEDSKGRIWIGGYEGLLLFSPEKGIEKIYNFPPEKVKRPDYVQGTLEDHTGHIWFSSDIKGLAKLNPETGEIKHFLPGDENQNAIPSVSIVDMEKDRDGLFWLATDVGIVRFDPETYAYKHYDKNQGIENEYICAVICAGDGRIWMSTHAGVSVLDPLNGSFINYGDRDGLVNVRYYTRNKYYASNGTLYFGGKNGVDYFHPDNLRRNPTKPRMVLSRVAVDNIVVCSGKNMPAEGYLRLTPANNLLEIDFVGLHYASQEAVRYQYILDGLHDQWIDLGTEHKILLTHMKPGEYTFRAKARTPDGIESAEAIQLNMRVVPPFYATTWFRILTTGAFLSLLIGYFRHRETTIKMKDQREAEVNRQMNELEKRALQAQMNPHFIYNSMNAIQQFIIVHDVEGAMNYLSRFSRILRTVLNMSAENRIPLYEEIKLIEDYIELENMRFPDKFDYAIHVSPELNIHAIEIPPFFIQPQVENAIRHGLLRKSAKGHLRIGIEKDGTSMRIIVEDNGIGRKAAAAAKSKETVIAESRGMAIVEERLKHIHAPDEFKPVKTIDLINASGEPAGTRVEITLPIDE